MSGVPLAAPLSALLSNIRLEWKLMAVTNTLAFYGTAPTMAVKSLTVLAQGPVSYNFLQPYSAP